MVARNRVLIPGAGGVGRAVFEQLRAQDVPVRFMVRREDARAAEVKGLGAEVVIGDLTRPETRWQAGLSRLGLPPHVEQHVATMARLHRDNRYDRTADGVERVTGIPPQSIEAFVAARRDFYLGLARVGGPGRPGQITARPGLE
jgi:nucleoside-diphosphate-sugar epimerase